MFVNKTIARVSATVLYAACVPFFTGCGSPIPVADNSPGVASVTRYAPTSTSAFAPVPWPDDPLGQPNSDLPVLQGADRIGRVIVVIHTDVMDRYANPSAVAQYELELQSAISRDFLAVDIPALVIRVNHNNRSDDDRNAEFRLNPTHEINLTIRRELRKGGDTNPRQVEWQMDVLKNTTPNPTVVIVNGVQRKAIRFVALYHTRLSTLTCVSTLEQMRHVDPQCSQALSTFLMQNLTKNGLVDAREQI